ncbi:MAG TPA: GlsB/YeaQ/YmgE family stress response membrane protein [Coriobacteriia bacterium]
MSILTWIIVGLIAGVIAKLVMRDSFGWIVTILLGIVGAFVGGWLSGLLGGPSVTGLNLMSILVAAGGAIVVLFVYGLVVRRRF